MAADPAEGMRSAIQQLRDVGVDLEALARNLKVTSEAVSTAFARTLSSPLLTGPLALAAAMRGSFLPSDLGVRSDAEYVDPALETLLAQSEVVTVGAERAWQLKPDVRRNVLIRAQQQGELPVAAQETSPVLDARDGEGKLLRGALAGDIPDLDRLSIDDLEKLATVSEWLSETDLAKLPTPAELRRIIQQRELLDPFRQLVGRTVLAEGDGSQDRVVGRGDEMERLSAYVGIVAPEQLKHYVTRGLSSLWSTITFSDSGNEPFLIQGVGGMGKSTLIGKFVLDHALIPGIRLPFVYLDFDRAALAPRQPLQLLIDIALQLDVWFPEMESALKVFRADMRSAIDGQARDESRRVREEQTRSELKSCCRRLRNIVEEFNRARAPVLVLLDTFEVVQYDDAAVQSVASLISALSASDGTDPWNNLRIVVAGRAEMPEIKTSHEPVVLGRLSLPATRELIARRNASDQIGLLPKQISLLAKPLRNSPLDVVVVMNWLKSRTPDERPKFIEEMVAEVENKTSEIADDENGAVVTTRITGILIGRMIKHINDPEVQRLADPGLVVRAVTPGVIRAVMAPASGLVNSADELPEGAENELFRRLARERWLVEERGSAIRHRPEVRIAMLSLMRRHDKQQFAATNERAVTYFRRQPPDDRVARAEAIYHMLLGGTTDLTEVDALWTADVGSLLSSAVDDLEGRSQDYLKARLGRTVPQDVLASLPISSLLSVLLSHGKRILQRTTPENFIGLLRTNQSIESNPDLLSLKLEALYGAGRWSELLDLARDALAGKQPGPLAEIASALREGAFDRVRITDNEAGNPSRFLLRWATRDTRSDTLWSSSGLELEKWASGLAHALQHSDTYWDFGAFACAGTRMAPNSTVGPTALRIARELCQTLKRLPTAANEGGALRVLAIFDDDPEFPILRRIDFASHFSTVSGAELRAFQALVANPGPPAEALDVAAADRFNDALDRGRKLCESMSGQRSNIVIADTSMTREFAKVIQTLVEMGTERTARQVRAMLTLTHPDWPDKLGNALTRAFQGTVPSKIGWLSSIERYLGSTGRQSRSSAKPNGHEILALADEAGSLPEAVSAYHEMLQNRSDPDAQNFVEVAGCFQSWVTALIRVGAQPLEQAQV